MLNTPTASPKQYYCQTESLPCFDERIKLY